MINKLNQIFVASDIKYKFDIKLNYKISMCKGEKKQILNKVIINAELMTGWELDLPKLLLM